MQQLSPSGETVEAQLARYALSRDAHLRDAIIERHAHLVRSVASRFVRPGVSAEDLAQTAWLALIRAVDRFDPQFAASFGTYAIHCMVGEIKRYFRDQTWAVKVPRRLQEIAVSLPRQRDRLSRALQREPTVAEMAEALGVPEEELLHAMELGYAYQPLRLDESLPSADGTDFSTLAETLGCVDVALEAIVLHAPLQKAIGALDERKQKVVRLRFFAGWSQAETADELGCSQMHVSRLERAALRVLRAAMMSACPA